VSKFGTLIQTHILKIFDIIVIILLVWAIRATILATMKIELIPGVNIIFEFTVPKWLLEILEYIGYNIELTFLENIDLFLSHFYLKIFSSALVFWALYQNGFSYIRKTAFDDQKNRKVWPFLIFGLFGTITLAIMNYSSLKPFLSVGYYIGVVIGACLFLWEKNKDEIVIFYYYISLIGIGIIIVWLISLWSIIISFIIGILFMIVFFLLRRYLFKQSF
jgi:hypothetical protein